MRREITIEEKVQKKRNKRKGRDGKNEGGSPRRKEFGIEEPHSDRSTHTSKLVSSAGKIAQGRRGDKMQT